MSTTHYPGCRCCPPQSGSGSSGSGDGPGDGAGSGSGSSGSGGGGCCAGYYLPGTAYLTFGGDLAHLGTLEVRKISTGAMYDLYPPAPAAGPYFCPPSTLTQLEFTVRCPDVGGVPGSTPGTPTIELIGFERAGIPAFIPRPGTHAYGTLVSCSPLLVTFAGEYYGCTSGPGGPYQTFTAVLTETPP